MAKKEKTKAAEGAENTEATEAKEKAPRGIVLTLEDGTKVGRSEHIRNLYASGNYTRGEIKDIINALDTSRTIPYQIVFAATKDMEGKKVERKAKAEKPAKEGKEAA